MIFIKDKGQSMDKEVQHFGAAGRASRSQSLPDSEIFKKNILRIPVLLLHPDCVLRNINDLLFMDVMNCIV